MSGFVFDAKGARAAIAIRNATAPAVPAVLAVEGSAMARKPQQPQQPQRWQAQDDTAIVTRQPQQPQASSGASPVAELIAPAAWFEGVAPLGEDEPVFAAPCDARRGRVEERDCAFLHFCVVCGAWGSYGQGVNLRAGHLGRWYCAAHRPRGNKGG